MGELSVYAEFLQKLNIVRIDVKSQSFECILGHIEVLITKPNHLKLIYDNNQSYTIILNDLYLDTESITNFKRTDTLISFNLKCSLNKKKNTPQCKCSKNIGNRLKNSLAVCCSFCCSIIADTKQITKIKSEISKNNQLEEIFYCHGNEEKLTDISLEIHECVVHGLEFTINKILLTNDNIATDKKILSCFRCQKTFGRYDSMVNNQLKLYSTELLVRLPKYDADGDIVDEESAILCNSEVEICHLMVTEIISQEATRVLLIGIHENKLINVALLWNLQQTFSAYRAKIDLGSISVSDQIIERENHYRLLCLPNREDNDNNFRSQLDMWNRDMQVYHLLAPRDACMSFVSALLNSRSEGASLDGFIPCSVRLDGC